MMMFIQFMPQWYHNLDPLEPGIVDLVERGICYQLKDRDPDGTKIFTIQANKLIPDKDDANIIIRAATAALHALAFDEIAQICGVILIIDCNNLSISHLKMLPLSFLVSVVDAYRFATPFRIKACYVINVPSFFNSVLEFVVNRLKEKIKQRIKTFKSLKELHKEVSVKILPEEYGGVVPKKENVEYFLEILKNNQNHVIEVNGAITHFPTFKLNDAEDCNIPGSFRKLEID